MGSFLGLPFFAGIALGYIGHPFLSQILGQVTGMFKQGKYAESSYAAFNPSNPDFSQYMRGNRDTTPWNPAAAGSFRGFLNDRNNANRNAYDAQNMDPYSAYATNAIRDGRMPASQSAVMAGVQIVAPSKRFDRDYQNYEQGNLQTLPPMW